MSYQPFPFENISNKLWGVKNVHRKTSLHNVITALTGCRITERFNGLEREAKTSFSNALVKNNYSKGNINQKKTQKQGLSELKNI